MILLLLFLYLFLVLKKISFEEYCNTMKQVAIKTTKCKCELALHNCNYGNTDAEEVMLLNICLIIVFAGLLLMPAAFHPLNIIFYPLSQ